MDPEKKYWLDDARNVKKIVHALYLVCALLLLADFGYDKQHTHFELEEWRGFFGLFGLVACVALVLAAKVLRVLLKREEDYYDH
jgi:phosphatidylserine synthase